MAERQVSVGSETYPLPPLFLVMATQNPIEQEGTYPLPEAQLDRFLLHVYVDYPSREAESAILKLARNEAIQGDIPKPPELPQEAIFAARQGLLELHMAEPVERYIVELVIATRDPAAYSPDLANWLEYGGSPRATIALDRCARAHAWLRGSDFVSPDDVQAITHDALRHRLILSFEAEAGGINADAAIDELLKRVPVA
jgi:MoxR-like ATPase